MGGEFFKRSDAVVFEGASCGGAEMGEEIVLGFSGFLASGASRAIRAFVELMPVFAGF